jgi:nitroreductase
MNNSNDRSTPEPLVANCSEPFSPADYRAVQNAITQRRTIKVLAVAKFPTETLGLEMQPSREKDSLIDDDVRQAIADSGWAPFHYDRKLDGIPEPWRFHVLWRSQCLHICENLHQWFDDVKSSNKTAAMLSACGALVLANWLPQFGTEQPDGVISREKQIQIDQEHLAATAAAIQNLLLLLTARNLGTYWSSGGLFRTDTMFQKLGINEKTEKLLGAIFIDYGHEPSDAACAEKIPGKNRDSRTNYRKWTREIVFDGVGRPAAS